jgi:hypothetical protein
MLVASEDEMVGTMSFASLTDAVAVGTEQWSTQHCVFIVETFFLKMATLLLNRSEYFASISIVLVTEKFLATIPYSYG